MPRSALENGLGRIFNSILVVLLLVVGLSEGGSLAKGPISQISIVKDAVIHTPRHLISHTSSFDVTFTLDPGSKKYKLRLEPNHDVVDSGTVVEVLDAEGKTIRTETIQRETVKVYRGDCWASWKDDDDWEYVGWARMLFHEDGTEPLFDGAFSVYGDNHHVKLRSQYAKIRQGWDAEAEEIDGGGEYMVVYKDSDMQENFFTVQKRSENVAAMCNSDQLLFNTNPQHPVLQSFSGNSSFTELRPRSGLFNPLFSGKMSKRQNFDGASMSPNGFSAGVNLRDTIGSTQGCPTTRKVALFGIVADCTYMETFDGDSSAARKNIISQINQASGVYENTFNITLGLSTLVVANASCPVNPPEAAPYNIPCSDKTSIEDRLNIFSKWRGTKSGDGNAFWTQLTNCPTGASVGLSWLGMLCQSQAQSQGAQFVSGANVVAKTSTEWQVIAHEVGHTFGAVHDCDSSLCANANVVSSSQCCPVSKTSCDANGQYIMNPSTGTGITSFSPCTVGNICSAMSTGAINTTCLASNRGVKTITENRCGNGIVEEGEECDCGGEEGCANNACCDAKTCKFINNAVCDDANEDCCTKCQFAAAGRVCRPSNGPCDPEEICPGNAATCPTDQTAPNGQKCGSGLACASGQCTSRNTQCRNVMGKLAGVGNDTHACDSDSCQLTCTSPSFGSNVCYGMQQWYLDGTPCGSGGMCRSGNCVGSNVFNEVKNFVQNHKTLVIGLAAGIGGALVLLIICCCVRRWRYRRRVPKTVPGAYRGPDGGRSRSRMPNGPNMSQNPNNFYPPPIQPYNNYGGDQSYSQQPPMYAPPTYPGVAAPSRSVRYA